MEGRKIIAEYFSFSRRERIGVIALALLIIAVAFLPGLLPGPELPALSSQDSLWIAEMDRLASQPSRDSLESRDRTTFTDFQYDRREVPRKQDIWPGELFPFDPNTLDEKGWRRLGIPERTIRTIRNFQARGGRFRKPEDLARIYGLPPSTFSRLEPFVRIPQQQKEPPREQGQQRGAFDRKPAKIDPVDINAADTSAFIALPGIGSKLAARIVAFREKLGGFHSIGQLAEVYGIADSVYEKLKPYLQMGTAGTRKISLNKAGLEELKAHPYIRYQLAQAIIHYREEHGPFGQLEDLRKVMAVTEEVYRRVLPYLSLEE